MEKYIQQSTSLFGSLKNAVLGNPVTREFTLGEQIASFGPGLLWKVFDGKKKSTGQEVSVFILEKSSVDHLDKRHRELIYEGMRHGPQQLTKLRHPRILTVQHPLEESRDSLAFATEPVFASLSNILGKHWNFTTTPPKELKDFELYAVEKVYGLLQLAEGLSFLHNDANLNEGNLTADNIIITKGGQWKLAGFHFSSSKMNPTRFTEYMTNAPPCARQDLNYIAPEWIFAQSSEYSFDICKADMFSFGCLINAVYNHLKTPFDAGDSLPAYKKSTEQLSRLGSDYLKNVPLGVREHVQLLLNVSADARPDAATTISHPFFDDVAAMTLKYLDSLVQRDEITKSQFFKNLHHVLDKLPLRVLHQRILPPLFSEFPNHMMIPFVLPNVLRIAEHSSQEEYMRIIFPQLKKIFHIVKPVEVLLVFMQKMELLLKKTGKEEVKSFVLPLIFRALEAPSHQIQELVIGVIPDFVHMIDYSSLKNSIIPRMKVLVTKSPSLVVRVNTLVCIGKIMDHLDKFLLVDEIFPALRQIPSNDPAVLMAVLGIYKKTMNSKKNQLEKDYLATQAIPYLLALSMEPTLNAKQFNNFMSVIRLMFDRVEQEHRTKLEQLQKMQDEQRTSIDFVKAANRNKELSVSESVMSKVDDLVIGKPTSGASSKSPDSSAEFNKIFGLHENQGTQAKSEPLMGHSLATTKSNTPNTNFFNPVNRTSSPSSVPKLSTQMMIGNVGAMTVSAQGSYQPKQTPPNKAKTTFDTILSPEMKQFQSNQPTLSMAALQQQQQRPQHPQQVLTPQPTPYNQSQGMAGNTTPTMMQSQSQSITMFQTQTQMFTNNMQQNNPSQNTFMQNNSMQGNINNSMQGNPVNNSMQGGYMNSSMQQNPMNSSMRGNPLNNYMQGNPTNSSMQGSPMNNSIHGNPMNAMLQPSNTPLIPTKTSSNLTSQDINDLLL